MIRCEDGGTCGLGGYCKECPYKLIAELEAELAESKKVIGRVHAGNSKLIDDRDRYRKAIKQYLECQTTNQWVRHFKKALEGGEE